MRNGAKRMAVCAMLTALCVVLMLLGAVLELGMYAAPLFAGLSFLPVGRQYGRTYHLLVYGASCLLCFLLVPNIEQNLMLAGLFGWYPILRPLLQKLPRLLRLPAKLLFFNTVIVAIEALVMLVLVPETVGTALLWILLLLGNVVFFTYDLLIPRMDALFSRLIQ